jgi:hypothetical protein
MIHIETNAEANDTKTFNLRYLESVIGNLIESGKKNANECLPWVHVAIRQSEEISARDVLRCQTSVLIGPFERIQLPL